MAAAARAVDLFASRHVTGTHCLVIRTVGAFPAALSYADAAQSGVGKAAVVLGKLEMSLRFPGTIADTQPEIRVEWVGVDDLAGIHLPFRVPDALEFPECVHDLLAKHDRQQFAA